MLGPPPKWLPRPGATPYRRSARLPCGKEGRLLSREVLSTCHTFQARKISSKLLKINLKLAFLSFLDLQKGGLRPVPVVHHCSEKMALSSKVLQELSECRQKTMKDGFYIKKINIINYIYIYLYKSI